MNKCKAHLINCPDVFCTNVFYFYNKPKMAYSRDLPTTAMWQYLQVARDS